MYSLCKPTVNRTLEFVPAAFDLDVYHPQHTGILVRENILVSEHILVREHILLVREHTLVREHVHIFTSITHIPSCVPKI